MEKGMARWSSPRTIHFLILAVMTTAVFTAAYNFGMAIWEDRPQTLVQSLEVVIQSFTTTGYGQDAPWETTQMNVLVIAMQFAGIGLILAAINAFVVPWFRARFRPSAPKGRVNLQHHVVICGYTARTESFANELSRRDIEYVVIETDEERATALHEEGVAVVFGDPESIDSLGRAAIERARAVVADAPDDVNASIVLSVRELNEDVPVITVVENHELDDYHEIAGADHVLSPRQLLGEGLAGMIPTAVTTAIDDSVDIGEELELVELTVQAGSDLDERRVRDIEFSRRFGVSVIGMWIDDEFHSPVDPDDELGPATHLLVAGKPDGIEELRREGMSSVSRRSPQVVLVAGRGESGTAAANMFDNSRTKVTVLDVTNKPGVDIVGDARDPEILRDAGISEASALIVTVGDDTTAIFTTLIAKDLNPDIEIYVRANHQENVPKLVRAGADQVESLASVSGRMIAATIFEEEIPVAVDREIRIIEIPAEKFADTTVTELRDRTGLNVLAIVRENDIIARFDPQSVPFEQDDRLILAGSAEQVENFEQTFE